MPIMKRPTLLTQIMAEPIEFPGFPQIVTTRGFAYQWLKACGWSESERGFGSLDYIIFAKSVATEPLTPDTDREYWLGKVRHNFVREPFTD